MVSGPHNLPTEREYDPSLKLRGDVAMEASGTCPFLQPDTLKKPGDFFDQNGSVTNAVDERMSPSPVVF